MVLDLFKVKKRDRVLEVESEFKIKNDEKVVAHSELMTILRT